MFKRIIQLHHHTAILLAASKAISSVGFCCTTQLESAFKPIKEKMRTSRHNRTSQNYLEDSSFPINKKYGPNLKLHFQPFMRHEVGHEVGPPTPSGG